MFTHNIVSLSLIIRPARTCLWQILLSWFMSSCHNKGISNNVYYYIWSWPCHVRLMYSPSDSVTNHCFVFLTCRLCSHQSKLQPRLFSVNCSHKSTVHHLPEWQTMLGRSWSTKWLIWQLGSRWRAKQSWKRLNSHVSTVGTFSRAWEPLLPACRNDFPGTLC